MQTTAMAAIGMAPVIMPFLSVVIIVLLVLYFGYRRRRAVQETIRAAIQSGQTLTPETIIALGAEQAKKRKDLEIYWGVSLIAVAVACIVFGWAGETFASGENTLAVMAGVAAFPGFLGIALLGLGIYRRRGEAED